MMSEYQQYLQEVSKDYIDIAQVYLEAMHLDAHIAATCPRLVSMVDQQYTQSICDPLIRFFASDKTASWIDYYNDAYYNSPLNSFIIMFSIGLVLYWILKNILTVFFRFFKSSDKRGLNREAYILSVQTFNDFAPMHQTTYERWFNHIEKYFGLKPETSEFTKRVLLRSGIGNDGSGICSDDYPHNLPSTILNEPPSISIRTAREEAEIVLFNIVDKALAESRVKPKDIDILVVNCSLFAPTPSLAAMIINHYRLRENIVVYNLGGMGCSAGLISIDLAADLLQMSYKPDAVALVVSTENLTQNLYKGTERSMLVTNALFRMGGAAIVLTNTSKQVKRRAKPSYKLTNLVRVHLGRDDEAYKVVYQDIDNETDRFLGVRLEKRLTVVAAKALTKNVMILGNQILPMYEKLRYVCALAIYKIKNKFSKDKSPQNTDDTSKDTKIVSKPPVPNFMKAVDYVAIHAGGRGVIESIKAGFGFSDYDCEPSYSVLCKYGNTSSSSVWYEFKEIEAMRKIKKGQKIWQISFGSGFKCNTAVWQKI